MSKTYFSVVSNRTWNTESLKTFTDCCSSISSSSTTFLNSDSCTYCVSPACIFKTNWLNLFNLFVNI